MIIRILGSAAGGGLPQWNCNCENCRAVRAHRPGVTPRTQTSIAVSIDGARWMIVNASPDLLCQIAATPALQPAADASRRLSPISAVILTGGEIDQIAGLLHLREGSPFDLYATQGVLGVLAMNPMLDALRRDIVARKAVRIGEAFAPLGDAHFIVTAFAVPGKAPLYFDNASKSREPCEVETIGLRLEDARTGKVVAFVPCCAQVTDEVLAFIAGADILLFDGTLYSENELGEQGLSSKTGAGMGHICIGGPEGSMARLGAADVRQRIYIHLNNSNPVLREESRERQEVRARGWQVAYDGMELTL